MLEQAGFETIHSPVMGIEFEPNDIDLSRIAALAFTSANGLRAFEKSSGVRDLPVFAVGTTTAQAAHEAGFQQIIAAGGDVAQLSDIIGMRQDLIPRGKTVLHVAGTHRKGDLAAALGAQGIDCVRLQLYRAGPVTRISHELKEALLDDRRASLCVSLFSPRSADLFIGQLNSADLSEAVRDCVCLCLSPAVAEAAGKLIWRDILVSEKTDSAAMISLLSASMLGTNNI